MISEVTVFKTSDGQAHATLQLAEAHESFSALAEKLAKDIYLRGDVDPQDVVGWISANKDLVRDFLDRTDAAL